MCGIAGYIALRRDENEVLMRSTVTSMTEALRHRGPDDQGVWVDASAGIALGHRRLSIIDLSAAGHQPMVSAGQRYVLAFNGEIYNFADLRRELSALGHSFRGHSDTEVFLAAVTEWGVGPAVSRFVGMFAFALWDRERRVLHLGRDRIGEKPLYYGWSGGAFLFGSELKALREHPSWRGAIDREALTLFLRFAYVPAPYSIHSGIRKLLPGTILEFSDPSVGSLPEPVPYWTLRGAFEQGHARPFGGDDGEAVDALDSVLRNAIRGQMVSDVPLGAFLSGGIDSSTVVALMQAQSASPVRTFSIGFREEGFDEAGHAREVARHLGTEHTELYVTPSEAMDVIPSLPTLYDEPFADSSQVPTYLVSRLARSSVTVSLSGDGGDELFGGYVRYQMASRIWRGVGWMPSPVRRAFGGALGRLPSAGLVPGIEAAQRVLPARFRQRRLGEKLVKLGRAVAADGPVDIYRGLVSMWGAPDRAVVGGREPSTLLETPDAWPPASDFVESMMYLDTMTYLPDDILVKVDRAAMAVSLESRVPLLDHRVVEFAASLPLHLKIREGETKWLLRQVLARYVPRTLTDRPKAGFAVPVEQWLRGPLREWAEELLDERRLREAGLLSAPEVRRLWDEHIGGTADRQYPIWCVLMFEAWRESVLQDVPLAA